jgi:hypothetical protein
MNKNKFTIMILLAAIAYLGFNFLTKEYVFYRNAIIICDLICVAILFNSDNKEGSDE